MTDENIPFYDHCSQVPYLEIEAFYLSAVLYRHDRRLTQFLRARMMPTLARAFSLPRRPFVGESPQTGPLLGTIYRGVWYPHEHLLFMQDGVISTVSGGGEGIDTYYPSSHSWHQKREQRRKRLTRLAELYARFSVLPALDALLEQKGTFAYDNAFAGINKILTDVDSEHCSSNTCIGEDQVNRCQQRVRGILHAHGYRPLGPVPDSLWEKLNKH